MKVEERLRRASDEVNRHMATLTPPPLASRPRLSALSAGLLAACVVLVLLALVGVLVRPDRPVAPTTITQPSTTTTKSSPTTSTLAPTTTVAAASGEKFIPMATIQGGIATLAVEFLDGSTAELAWPADLDLLSGGVVPYGWAYLPNVAARDFFVRRGVVEEVVALFGEPELLTEYPDGRGGAVTFWRPGEWPDVDFLAFKFDSWVVLVYDYRPGALELPMSEEARALWATHLHGRETEDGFLRLSASHPLVLAPAGAYPSPMSMEFTAGHFELVPEDCQPGFVTPIAADADFFHWCDESGLISMRVSGSPEYAQTIYDQLEVREVRLAGVQAPDTDGSYEGLAGHLSQARRVWDNAEVRAYQLRIEGVSGFESVDVTISVRDGEAVVKAGSWSQGPVTVEHLFDLIAAAIAAESGDLEVRFHPDLGYPTGIGLYLDQRQSDGAVEIHVQLTPD